jgi:hypothetical protein
MPAIIYGIRLFAVSLGGANVSQSVFSWRYHSHPHIFAPWYLVALYGALVYLAWPFSLTLALIMAGQGLAYVIAIYILNHASWFDVMYKVDSLPVAFKDVAHPTVRTAIVKILEVALQDMIAIIIVQGLLEYTGSFYLAALLFSVVVFLVHVPSIWLYGRFYGGYFLLLSTLLASSVVLLVSYSAMGFAGVIAIHLISYLALYIVWLYCSLGTKDSKVIEAVY